MSVIQMDVDDGTGIEANKIVECEVCSKNNAKYTCPRCEVRTCSLDCNKIHKKELECDGVRDKVKFKMLKDFNNIDLLNDYRLLEETARLVKKSNKLPPTTCYSPKSGTLAPELYRLKCVAQTRGVYFYFLPPSFSRHISNTTYLDHENQRLYWRIEWIFPQAGNITITDERIIDSTLLSACVHKYIDPENSFHPSLMFYQAAGHPGIKILLKAERTTSNRFFLLDPTVSLRENLQGKPIIEFPIMYVILSHHVDMYSILSEEEEKKLKRNRTRTRNPQKRHTNTPSNYFFPNQMDEDGKELKEDMMGVEDGTNEDKTSEFNLPDSQDRQFYHRGRGRGMRGHFRGRWRGNNRHGRFRGRGFRGRQGDISDHAINGGLSKNFGAVSIES